MWERVKTFAYPKSIDRLKIQTSELNNSAVLGAAALFYDAL
jgi:glucokinase